VAYEIILKPPAQRDLDSLPQQEIARIAKRLALLSTNPRPFGVQKLSDEEGYRIRSGKYRILYEVNDRQNLVFVYRIKHRRDAYR